MRRVRALAAGAGTAGTNGRLPSGAVRDLRLAHPKPLLAKLREQQLDLGAGNKEVREALAVLKAQSEATKAATAPPAAAAAPSAVAAPPAAGEGGVPLPASLVPSLACFGCARPSEMGDDRVKHPVCPKCVKLKMPTTYWCCVNCPGNPGAWKRHAVYHKEVKGHRNRNEDGGVTQQRDREFAEEAARIAAQTGDKYQELLADGARYGSKDD